MIPPAIQTVAQEAKTALMVLQTIAAAYHTEELLAGTAQEDAGKVVRCLAILTFVVSNWIIQLGCVSMCCFTFSFTDNVIRNQVNMFDRVG